MKQMAEVEKHVQPRHKWDRLILLENHDVRLRTYEELQYILLLFGESKSQNGNHNPPEAQGLKGDYSRAKLHTMLNAIAPITDPSFELSVTHGYMQASLTRKFVDTVIGLHSKKVFNGFITQLSKEERCSHDRLFPTLIYTDELRLPGHSYRVCSQEYPISPNLYECYMGQSIIIEPSAVCCLSGTIRNWICLPGLRYLDRIARLPHLFYNKLSPAINYPAYNCLMEAVETKSRRFSTFLNGIAY